MKKKKNEINELINIKRLVSNTLGKKWPSLF